MRGTTGPSWSCLTRHRAELGLSNAPKLELTDAPQLELFGGPEMELSSARVPPGRAGAVRNARHRPELELSDARTGPS